MQEADLRIYQTKLCSPEEAVGMVQSGQRVWVGNSSSVAYTLFQALLEREDVKDITLCCSNIFRDMGISRGSREGRFRYESYFIGPDERRELKRGFCSYSSLHLSQVDRWMRDVARPDIAFLSVSPPDEKGFVSLGPSGVCTGKQVLENSSCLILQVNRNVPYLYGEDNLVHISRAAKIVEAEEALPRLQDLQPSPELEALSALVLGEIPDGATIQVGLGGVAMAIGYGLKQRNDLGIHSELMTGSMLELMRLGIVNNRCKTWMPGRSVVGFALGSVDLYQYMDKNPAFCFMPFTVVNDPYVIAKNDNMISVNTAMAIDLTGQVAADCLGFRQQSATGGQVDFVRGAQLSRGGKSIIALTAAAQTQAQGRVSRIVSSLPAGSAVTTPRSDVQYVATEYGCVNLKGLSMPDRVRAMISLAHPDFRDGLRDDARKAGLLPMYGFDT